MVNSCSQLSSWAESDKQQWFESLYKHVGQHKANIFNFIFILNFKLVGIHSGSDTEQVHSIHVTLKYIYNSNMCLVSPKSCLCNWMSGLTFVSTYKEMMRLALDYYGLVYPQLPWNSSAAWLYLDHLREGAHPPQGILDPPVLCQVVHPHFVTSTHSARLELQVQAMILGILTGLK